MHTAKCLFAECQKKALGKDAFCRVPKNKLGKMPLCRVSKKGTRQRRILPSAEKWHSAKYIFVECQKKRHSAKTYFAECRKMALGKIHLCRVPKKTLGKTIFTECRKNTWQSHLCRVPDKKHSAKLPALGKVPVSSSVYYTKPRVNYLFEALNKFKSKSGQLQSS